MFFLPFKVDLNFNRLPIVTGLICIICIVIFMQQKSSEEKLRESIKTYCQAMDDWEFELTLEKIAGEASVPACFTVLGALYYTKDKGRPALVKEMLAQAASFDSLSEEAGKAYLKEHLERKIKEFDSLNYSDLTSKLLYDPKSYNIVNMVTAAFAHGDWSHIGGNLFFFFVFAASVEMILGWMKFIILVLALAIGTHLSYSVSVAGVANAASTLGLSGVVMGMIGVFAYMMPTVKIRCFLWFLVIVRFIAVPAWILAIWYVGWDIYDLNNSDNESNINFVAHISGAFLGYFFGVFFLKSDKNYVKAELADYYDRHNMVKAMSKGE